MIIYDKLWETMKSKGFSKYRLTRKHGITQSTLARMSKNMPTSSVTINDLCQILDCNVEDIMTFVPDPIEVPIIEQDHPRL